MYGPFPSADVEARLTNQVKQLRLVGNAADLSTALKQAPNAVPAAFVLRSERGDRPKGFTSGTLVQNINVSLQVVLWVRNYAKARTGSGARADMDRLQTGVRKALIGWQPSPEFDTLSLDAERDENFTGGALVTQSVFRSQYRLQTEVNP